MPGKSNKRKEPPAKEVEEEEEKKSSKEEEEEEEDEETNWSDFPTLPLTREKALQEKGFKFVCGVDEAGRGPLAGPVCAAACVVPVDIDIPGVNDSKTLKTEELREELYEILVHDPRVIYSVCLLDADYIDGSDILSATMEAMTRAIKQLPRKVDYVLIDGNKVPPKISAKKNIQSECVVKGDGKIYSIAAASIIAKVTRDRIMNEYHNKHPEYNFVAHKGYGTRDHIHAISKHGAIPGCHRMTFAPLKTMYPEHPAVTQKSERDALKKAAKKLGGGVKSHSILSFFQKKTTTTTNESETTTIATATISSTSSSSSTTTTAAAAAKDKKKSSSSSSPRKKKAKTK